MNLQGKVFRMKFVWKKYSFFYLVTCFFRKLHLSFLLKDSSLFIDRGDYRLHYKNEPFINTLFVNPKMVREDEMFIKAFLEEGNNYIDIGANIGTTTLCASRAVGKNGKIFAFEPHLETYLFLKKNISLNHTKNINVYNLALGDKEEKLFITNEVASDINHLVSEGDISVDVKTLDSVLPDIQKIRLLKVDVEGFEEAVFRGAQKTLEKTDIVFFESSKKQYDRYGFSFENIFDILKSKKFNIYHLSFKHKEVIFEEILNPKYLSGNVENICASKQKMPKSISFRL